MVHLKRLLNIYMTKQVDIDTTFHMFDTLAVHITLYGSEVWGCETHV